MTELYGSDAYAPSQVARRVETVGVAKPRMAERSVVDKAVAVIFPIAAFVAAGFEHSIANIAAGVKTRAAPG